MVSQRRFRREYYGYLFILPFVTAFLIFGLWPVINTVLLSFTNTTLMKSSSEIVGLRNYTRLFADDTFMTAIGNTWRAFAHSRRGHMARPLLFAQFAHACRDCGALLQPLFLLWPR